MSKMGEYAMEREEMFLDSQDDAAAWDQVMQDRHQELVEICKRGICGMLTLQDWVILCSELGTSDECFPKH